MLANKIIPLLKRDYGFKEVESGDFLRQGVCPNCGKKELFTPRAHPWVLRCGRLNKCGAEFHVKELYPEIFNDWSKNYPAQPQNPNASADAYLSEGRGFDLAKIRGWYRQESYYDQARREGTATVRFALAGGAAWERFIDRPERFGDQKARFIGGYKGAWWQPPTLPEDAREIWLVEGIFDAIALMHRGIAAVAILSCVNYPDVALAELAGRCAAAQAPRPALVWALDGDEAGRKYIWRHAEKSRADGWETSAAVPPDDGRGKLDWNDLLQRDRLGPDDIAQYRHAGKILLARSAAEKAALLWARDRRFSFPLDFARRMYWAKLDPEKFSKATAQYMDDHALSREGAEIEALKECLQVSEICNCLPRPLHFLANLATGEAWYYFRVDFPHDGTSIKDRFTPAQLSSAPEFKKRLLSFPGAVWSGNSAQLDRCVERWTYNIKRVETIDFLGYSLPHKAWIFNDAAICGGKLIEPNADDYFEIGKTSIRSLSKERTLMISREPPARGWFGKFHLAFGDKGVVALGFWLGSLFAEQIRERHESWPFLEIVGEPGSGKTTLLETLWKLLGRAAYEGFDPMKASSIGFLRTMAQFSNLPVVLIEADRENTDGSLGRARQQFYWDSLKSLYNGGSLRTTGVKSGGNDTYDPQFRAALVISQNNQVQASQAIMERIVHLAFDKRHQSEEGRAAATELGRMTPADLSGWILKALLAEKQVLSLIEKRLPSYENLLAGTGVKNQRLQKNYAMVMAMIEALPSVSPIPKDAIDAAIALLSGLARSREQELARDHPIIERFWEVFEYLNGTGAGTPEDDALGLCERLNHSRDPGLIAVNLNHFVQAASDARQQIPDLADLKKYLSTSRRHKFVEANVVVSSAINARINGSADPYQTRRPASIRCWLFKRGGGFESRSC
jgi:hypothetical protein